jgi:serine/threonine protein kinase
MNYSIIGEGASGIVISPNLPTKKFNKSSKNFVSKLLKRRKFKNEKTIEISKFRPLNEIEILYHINSLDPKQEYYVSFEDIEELPNDNDFYYNIVMKNYGESISQLNKKFRKNKFLKNVRYLYENLYFLHNNNIVHRDISINNILYSKKEDKLRIMDFGTGLNMVEIKYILSQKFLNKINKDMDNDLKNQFNFLFVHGSNFPRLTRKLFEFKKSLIYDYTMKNQYKARQNIKYILHYHKKLDLINLANTLKEMTNDEKMKKLMDEILDYFNKNIDLDMNKFLNTFKL